MVRRLALGVMFVAVVLGCGGGESSVTVDPVPGAVAPPIAAPVAGVTGLDPKVVDAYVESCGHVFPANIDPQFSENDPSNECTWREFEQNCAPDLFGCWTKGENCRDACHAPCVDCQSKCTDSCDSCKASCGGDAGCVRKCAETRAQCRTGCMSAHDGCTAGPTCAKIEADCSEAGEKQKAEKCPRCGEIEACISDGWNGGGGDPTETCKAKFPGTAEECWTWCGYIQ